MQRKLAEETVDVSLNTQQPWGALHPVTLVENQMTDLLVSMGFEVLSGPEIETDYYNFQALNIPADHPARDMQDTFYITDNILLRTQTSAMQARLMEHKKPPIKMICPGKVFRSDSDASHSPVFHQIEGLVVDENITLCCGGKGCSLCKGTGWIEVLGAGMVNPFVLENCGIDSQKYTGFAFGWGVERIAMIKYGIPDIRLFYENDQRFLKQFGK